MTTPMYVRVANGNCLTVDPNSTQSHNYRPASTTIPYYPDLVNTSAEFSNDTPTYIKPEHNMTDTMEIDDQSKMVFCKFPTEEKKVESIDELFENSELFANLGNGDLSKDKAKDFAKDLTKDKEIFIDAIDKTIKRQSIGEAKIISLTTIPCSAIVSIEIFTHNDDLSVKKQTKFVTTTNPAKFTQLINRTFANLNQHIINLEDELSDLSY